jgi:hypothetical protein
MSKGKIKKYKFEMLRTFRKIIFKVILVIKTNEFAKLFMKASCSPFFLA